MLSIRYNSHCKSLKKMRKHPERIPKTKPFIGKYNWEGKRKRWLEKIKHVFDW